MLMETADSEGKPQLWLASLDQSAPPRQIPNVEGTGKPRFGPDGEILFRHAEGVPGKVGSTGFIYRVRPDGSGMQKALEQPISSSWVASRDGRWVEHLAPLPGHGPMAQAFPLAGGSPVLIGGAELRWSTDGGSVTLSSNTGMVFGGRAGLTSSPLPPGQMFPRIPGGRLSSPRRK